MHSHHDPRRAAKQYIDALTAGAVTEGLGQMTLADADLTHDEQGGALNSLGINIAVAQKPTDGAGGADNGSGTPGDWPNKSNRI